MQTMADAIRAEATRSNQDPIGRPLPLATQWVTGDVRQPGSVNWRPTHQLKLIGEGHYILPLVELPTGGDAGWLPDYFQGSFQTMASLHLPFTLRSTQWECKLSEKPFVSLPPDKNPNVVLADGKVKKAVSPFGHIELWRQAGASWTTGTGIRQLQTWYPDPPKVIFLSNNEHPSLNWPDLPKTMQYATLHKPGTPDLSMEAMRGIVASGYIPRYRALQQGMRDGLDSAAWKSNSIFVGYNAFGPDFMGRFSDWGLHCLYQKSIPRIDPAPLQWDGGSPSYYTNDWDSPTDFQVSSPQISFMNYLFMQDEAWRLNPEFWYEFSVWDGHPGKMQSYLKMGQTYDPVRYGGWVQFGMWLTRPRAVREYRDYTTPYTGPRDGDTYSYGDYFMALVGAVDRVHTNPTLQEWWRKGNLVPNRAHAHPFQSAIPEAYRDVDRWYLLDCDANPPFPWKLTTNLNVFSLAMVRGAAPQREWLIYAHSPLSDLKGVAITIPDYRAVTADVTRGGTFYQVDEKTGKVRNVTGDTP